MSTKRVRRYRGFTLIELLVVIAIIAVLAAILLPVLFGARQKSYQAGCMSNLRQLYLAYRMYEQDNDGRFPPWHNFWTATTQADYGAAQLRAAMDNYVRAKGVWYCHSAFYQGQSAVWSGVDQRYTGYLVAMVRWHYKMEHVSGRSDRPLHQIPLAGDPTGQRWDRDTPGLEYPGLPHQEGQVILWADGHAKWSPGVFTWQAVYP
jgi:prepilin-type N-terminal cleavage/methylation domain-containing protein